MKNRRLLFVLMAMSLTTAIVLYNFWAYSCGRCTLKSFMALSPPAIILIFCNIAAFLLLCSIKSRSKRQHRSLHCSCGNLLQKDWEFCPNCGSACKHHQANPTL